MFCIGHNKILHPLFCPDFEQNVVFSLTLDQRRSGDTKSSVNIKAFFILSSF